MIYLSANTARHAKRFNNAAIINFYFSLLSQISAQESRRKKKEYMDALERKVEMLSSQNGEYRKKISTLEDANCSLLSQLQRLQQMVAGLQPVSWLCFRITGKLIKLY